MEVKSGTFAEAVVGGVKGVGGVSVVGGVIAEGGVIAVGGLKMVDPADAAILGTPFLSEGTLKSVMIIKC